MTPRKEKNPPKIPIHDKPGQSRPPPEEIEEEKQEQRLKEEKEKAEKEQAEREKKKEPVIIIEPIIKLGKPPTEQKPVEKRKPFPHSLGPFGIRPTQFKKDSFGIAWEDVKDQGKGGMFTMEKPAFGKNTSLRILAGPIRDWPVVGQFSPAHPITLSDAEKKAALIPTAATAFVWAYPVAISVDVNKLQGIDPADPDLAFLMVGGYVYFNKEHQVCGVNTIVPADTGLVFSKPKKWNHDLTRYLAKSGRFQPITIKALHDCGARWYCWIRPDEPLIDEGWGTSEKLCPNGGFAYLFHDKFHEGTKEQMEKDCYYHVLNGEEYEEELARIRASIQKYGR